MAAGPPREELAKRFHLQQQACSKYRVDSSRQCPSLRATTAVSLSIKVGCLRAIPHPEGIVFDFVVEHVRVLVRAARETHCIQLPVRRWEKTRGDGVRRCRVYSKTDFEELMGSC